MAVARSADATGSVSSTAVIGAAAGADAAASISETLAVFAGVYGA